MLRLLALALAPVVLTLLGMAGGATAEHVANGYVVVDGLLLALTVAALTLSAAMGAFLAAADAAERACHSPSPVAPSAPW